MLSEFPTGAVLDFVITDVVLNGVAGGFSDGTYGHFVPFWHRAFSGKVRRFTLSFFMAAAVRISPRVVLDLTMTDALLQCFTDGFNNASYDDLAPYSSGAYFGEVPRFILSDFSARAVLDLTITDAELRGFAGGCSDGTYGYFVPGALFHNVCATCLSVVLGLAAMDALLTCLAGGFSDATYGRLVPCSNGTYFWEAPRFMLSDLSAVAVLEFTLTDAELKGFAGRARVLLCRLPLRLGHHELRGVICESCRRSRLR
jgi:hypothetical protein